MNEAILLGIRASATWSAAPDCLWPHELDQDGWSILLGIGIGLSIIVLELGCLGVERHQLLETQSFTDSWMISPARSIPAHDVALLQEMMQQSSGLDA